VKCEGVVRGGGSGRGCVGCWVWVSTSWSGWKAVDVRFLLSRIGSRCGGGSRLVDDVIESRWRNLTQLVGLR
jgi:hypothetical protein